jgi:uncharacterized paraquat-inducible protein A
MKNNNISDNLIACLQCDALSVLPDVLPEQEALCSGCGGTLFSRKKNSVE